MLAIVFTAGVSAAQSSASVPAGTAPGLEGLDLEQLMKIEVIVAASKRAQTPRDVPSFVSVVTAAQIRAHGYRTLADVLRTLSGFYVSNDRNYSYLGVRGFGRPGDYNARVLLMVNGLRTNDNIYDGSSIGEEFGVDLDNVERIEIVRGPSAAIYGSNAFFAVINVVTRSARSLNGGEVGLSAASFGTYAARATYGRALASDAEFVLSASFSDSKGRRLFFPEFDDPETNDGISVGADRESYRKLLATARKGNFSFQASHVSREKGIPTGSYATVFGDPRAQTTDGISLASLSYGRTAAGGASFSTRLHGGHWAYTGIYPGVPDLLAGEDVAIGEWWGIDVDAARAFSRHFLTVGAEFRDNYKQDQKTYEREPAFVYTDVHHQSRRFGIFAQDDVRIAAGLNLHAGLRVDRYDSFGYTASPRLGLVYSPGATTVKLLAGRAFRAPNEFELHYESSLYRANPRLRPEHIGTLEAIVERRLGRGVQLTGSFFRNDIDGLISQVVVDDLLLFINSDRIRSRGLELSLAVTRGHGLSGALSYTLQRTEERFTHVDLTNSPREMAKLQLIAPLPGAFSAALDAQYVSGRRTRSGDIARRYVVTNVSFLAPRLWNRFDLAATIYNFFDAANTVPVGDEFRQDVLQQDGRSFRVKTTIRF